MVILKSEITFNKLFLLNNAKVQKCIQDKGCKGKRILTKLIRIRIGIKGLFCKKKKLILGKPVF